MFLYEEIMLCYKPSSNKLRSSGNFIGQKNIATNFS